MRDDAACRCGSARVLVRSGTVVRVGMRGVFPYSVSFAYDPFETAVARCAGCGTGGGPVRAAGLAAAAEHTAADGAARQLQASYGEPFPQAERLRWTSRCAAAAAPPRR